MILTQIAHVVNLAVGFQVAQQIAGNSNVDVGVLKIIEST